MAKNTKPTIRFKGFTDDWEQRKFGDTIQERREKSTKENEDTLLSCAINGIFLNSDLFSHFRGSSNIGYLKIRKNDLILSAQNLHLGNCNVNLTYDHGIVSPAYKVYELVNCYPYFMQAWVKKDCTKQFFLKAATEGASVCRKNIVWEDLYKQNILIPSYEEQVLIGDYFYKIDNLITLHQRKYDSLVNVKKAMFEKLFPKNGETVPEIRFKGFTDTWEQCKVSEIAETTFGGGTPKTSNDSFWIGNIPWIQSSDLTENILFDVVPKKHISQEAIDKSATKLVPKNSVAIVTRVGVGKLAFMPFSYATSQDFLSLSKLKTEPQFTVYVLYKKLQSELNAVQGTSIKGITKDELLTKVLMIPCYEEQDKIGRYLHFIDNLITLHQRRLEKLKNIKKSCLEKMFV